MEYITVLNNSKRSSSKIDYTSVIIEQAYGALTSLIDAFSGKEAGYDTTYKTALNIREFNRKYIKHSKKPLFIDSSGYSIINGDVMPWDTAKVIDCYHQYLEHEWQHYDYIFSLDIPINKDFPLFNTYQNIESFNHKSLLKSKQILEKYPEFADKFYFIYQFKCREHYEIWNKLYNELELGKVIKNWAVGGMVGLKRMAKITFSPFIGIAFKCLHDYLNSLNPNPILKIHFLGVFQKGYRFQIAFIEKLFQSYFRENLETLFTYDSISYIKQVQKKKNLEIFDFNAGDLNSYSLNELPDNIIEKVYSGDIYRNGFYSESERRNAGINVDNTSVFAPLSIYSNIQIDRLFEYIIETENMIDIFSNATSVDKVGSEFKKILTTLTNRYPKIFTIPIVNEIILNLQITFEFHKWYRDKRDKDSLHNLVLGFIKIINIKDMITKC